MAALLFSPTWSNFEMTLEQTTLRWLDGAVREDAWVPRALVNARLVTWNVLEIIDLGLELVGRATTGGLEHPVLICSASVT